MSPSPEKKDFICYAHDDLAESQKTMMGDIGYVKGKIDSVEDGITDLRRESIKQYRVLRAATNGNHREAEELEAESTQEIELPDKKLDARVKKLERWHWLLIGEGGTILYVLLNLKSIAESLKFMFGIGGQ